MCVYACACDPCLWVEDTVWVGRTHQRRSGRTDGNNLHSPVDAMAAQPKPPHPRSGVDKRFLASSWAVSCRSLFQVCPMLLSYVCSGLLISSFAFTALVVAALLSLLRPQGGTQALCRVHLVPIRGGLLALPRLDVTAEGGGSGVEVWTSDLRKVLVLPPGDAASVCQARAP